jgi:serpin B
MNMGMTNAFGQADLSGISDGAIKISDIQHVTYIKVDEDGTEAAAITAAFILGCAAPEKLVEFVVDRPFAYIIKEKSTGMILFMGRVVKM